MNQCKIALREFILTNAEREAIKVHLKHGKILANAISIIVALRLKHSTN